MSPRPKLRVSVASILFAMGLIELLAAVVELGFPWHVAACLALIGQFIWQVDRPIDPLE